MAPDVNMQADNLSPFLYAGATGQTNLVKLFLEKPAPGLMYSIGTMDLLIPACERGHIENRKIIGKYKRPLTISTVWVDSGAVRGNYTGDGSKNTRPLYRF